MFSQRGKKKKRIIQPLKEKKKHQTYMFES